MIATETKPLVPDFQNLEKAFASKSDEDLNRAYWLFKAMASNFLVNNGPALLQLALKVRMPVIPIVKKTLFRHFCGGENIADCNKTIATLAKHNIGSVLDYSVEGEEREEVFNQTVTEIVNTIQRSAGDATIPYCVFKVTGVARFGCLEKVSQNKIDPAIQAEYAKVKQRVLTICEAAALHKVRLFIDAEESWIQPAIDEMADAMMARFNTGGRAIVFNTIQLYRWDRLNFLKASHAKATAGGYKLGLKLVRGAYMEKERDRAAVMGYRSPIQENHKATNTDYDAALEYCVAHIDSIEICAGTHNESSSLLLVKLMQQNQLANDDDRIWFSQLLGMSDHISFNLSDAGYNVAKYVPYGPVLSVLPYLIRRAQENTSIAGQTGRELYMIKAEQQRRKNSRR